MNVDRALDCPSYDSYLGSFYKLKLSFLILNEGGGNLSCGTVGRFKQDDIWKSPVTVSEQMIQSVSVLYLQQEELLPTKNLLTLIINMCKLF